MFIDSVFGVFLIVAVDVGLYALFRVPVESILFKLFEFDSVMCDG